MNQATEQTSVDAPMETPERSGGWLKAIFRTAAAVFRLVLFPVMLVVAFFGVMVGIGLLQRAGYLKVEETETAEQSALGDTTMYVCPMLCTPPRPKPGRCPVCGMKLEPTDKGLGDQDPLAVIIDPLARRIAGIETAVAQFKPVTRVIRGVGFLDFDEGKQAIISSHVDGRIEKLNADYTGMFVPKGYALAEIYSPELYSAQVELLRAWEALQKARASGLQRLVETQQRLYEGAREKLIVRFALTPEQVDRVLREGRAQTHVTLYSPIAGTVIRKPKLEGQYVKAGQVLYEVADLSTVWLQVQLYPEEAALVRYGQRVEATVQSIPGRSFQGRVAFIDPVVDEKTRTVDVRVVLPNPEGLLKVGDYAVATIRVPVVPPGYETPQLYDPELAGKWISPVHPEIIRDEPGKCPICGVDLVPARELGYADQPVPHPKVVVIPRDAVLAVGGHSVVYVETDPGRFEIRRVTLGPLVDEETIVVWEGIAPGEHVARSGNFLIDSQMQLQLKPSIIDPTRVEPPKNRPLPLEVTSVTVLSGSSAQAFEQLLQAYLRTQKLLADDKPVEVNTLRKLIQAADQLCHDPQVPLEVHGYAIQARQAAEKMIGQTLAESRVTLKKLSRAMLRLAVRLRVEGKTLRLVHFFCPMVPGGYGDWLQVDDKPANPYWGHKMLRCAEEVHQITDAVPQRVAKTKGKEKRSKPKQAAQPVHVH